MIDNNYTQLIVGTFRTDCTEQTDILKSLKKFSEIAPVFFDSLKDRPVCDLYLLPSRELINIPQDLVLEYPIPILAFGPINTIGISLSYGITDFIIYPFVGEELPTRISKHVPNKFVFHDIQFFHFTPDKLFYKNRYEYITYTEYRILKLLVAVSPRPLQRELLLECLPNIGSATGRSLDMTISKLRKKLKQVLNKNDDILVAERGFGYRIIKK